MGTPNRTTILANMQTALEGITVANGYNTEVATVETVLRSRDDCIGAGNMPYIGFGIGKEQARHQMSGCLVVDAPIVVLGYLADGEWASRSTALNLFVDDIIKAMFVDPTFGGYATNMEMLGQETDEIDPDADCAGVGACVLEFKLRYDRTVGGS